MHFKVGIGVSYSLISFNSTQNVLKVDEKSYGIFDFIYKLFMFSFGKTIKTVEQNGRAKIIFFVENSFKKK